MKINVRYTRFMVDEKLMEDLKKVLNQNDIHVVNGRLKNENQKLLSEFQTDMFEYVARRIIREKDISFLYE